MLITTDNQIDVTTGTVKLKAQFPNDEGKLFPNQFVNVRMVVDVRKDAVGDPRRRGAARHAGHRRLRGEGRQHRRRAAGEAGPAEGAHRHRVGVQPASA